MKTLLEIQTLLEEKIPRSAVSQRDGGGGRSLSYLPGHYVISRINHIFGPFGWATDVKALDLLHCGEIEKYGKKVFTVHYKALVRLVVQGPDGQATEHTDVGYGDGSDKENIGKAHELAMKEAVTDAIKRCAKNLGGSMGLYLYDKDQTNVEEDGAGKPAAAPTVKETSGTQQPTSVASRPKLKDSPSDRPKAAEAPARDNLMRRISTLSKILNSTGRATFAQQKENLKAKYGADSKDALTDAQAAELVSAMETSAQAAS